MKIVYNRSAAQLFLILCFLAGALLGSNAKAQEEDTLSRVKPEAVGFSSERLLRLDALMQRMVDHKEFAGIVTVAARHGRVFFYKAYGMRDLASGAPMQMDTIFRLYSMTKPITSVAMMILYEEGKWSPSDQISKYIPEFSNLKVLKGFDAQGKALLEAPAHPPTMAELMAFTAGFGLGFGKGPEDKLYQNMELTRFRRHPNVSFGGVSMATKSVRYTPEFKRQMVDLVRGGRSPAELAREFEPTAWTISLWAKQAERDGGKGDGGLTTPEREELARLRRENRKLREEREILSKAAAWFATESGTSKRSSGS